MPRNYLTIVFLLLISIARANGAVASLTVTSTPETCSGNGTLTFTVADAPAGASIIYSIYKLPDLSDDVSTQTGNSLGGLTAGTYRVFASINSGGNTETISADAVVENQIVSLAYNFSPVLPVCGQTGSLTVNVFQGTAATYEIISGPVIVPPQASNVLAGLVAGVYEIRVVDICGEGWVQAYTMIEGQAGIALINQQTTDQECDSLTISLNLGPGPGLQAAYPITVVITINPPSGDPIVVNTVLTGPDDASGNVTFSETIPFFPGDTFTYSVHITDNCGNELMVNQTITPEEIEPTASAGSAGCDGSNIIVSNVSEVILTEAPDEYEGAVPGDFTPQIENDMVIISDVPPGTYVFIVKDICGGEHELEVVVFDNTGSGFNPGSVVIPGCGASIGGLALQGGIQTAVLTSAPTGYPVQLPQDFTGLINPFNFMLVVNNLPAGTYTFDVSGECGGTATLTANVPGYTSSTTADVTELCGTFNLFFNNVSNGVGAEYFLQKFHTGNGVWGHPYDPTSVYVEGTVPTSSNAQQVSNNVNNLNFSVMGQFRILKKYLALASGSFSFIECYEVLHEFTFDNMPEITNVYSFACSDGNFDVIVEAEGLPLLQYRITHKDGVPFVVNNGTSNVFTALEPATYNFEVRDGCNNIVNRLFKIVEPIQFQISAGQFCIGESAVLSVPNFPFLNYQWYETANPSMVLSTSATLTFPIFSNADSGNYTVAITSVNPQSCMSEILNYTVPAGIPQPMAGSANAMSVCNASPVNLFQLLAAPYDTGGTWTALSGGTVSGNIWDATGQQPGTYLFSYSVENPCGSQSVQTSLTLSESPEPITAALSGGGCVGSGITLTATGDPAYSYTWTLPDGTSATGQTLEIANAQLSNAGLYSVIAGIGSCEGDPVTVEVALDPLPVVSISNVCDGAVRWLTAEVVDVIFDPSDVSYSWTGPNGFTASGNPVSIATGTPGEYSVVVTTPEGCSGSASAPIANVRCMIQQGVSVNGDGNNDDFDLEGFEVENLQIFNRYGVTVYERANYINEWRGQDYKDRPLPAGTYYYLVRMAGGKHETGWVHLIREH